MIVSLRDPYRPGDVDRVCFVREGQHHFRVVPTRRAENSICSGAEILSFRLEKIHDEAPFTLVSHLNYREARLEFEGVCREEVLFSFFI